WKQTKVITSGEFISIVAPHLGREERSPSGRGVRPPEGARWAGFPKSTPGVFAPRHKLPASVAIYFRVCPPTFASSSTHAALLLEGEFSPMSSAAVSY